MELVQTLEGARERFETHDSLKSQAALDLSKAGYGGPSMVAPKGNQNLGPLYQRPGIEQSPPHPIFDHPEWEKLAKGAAETALRGEAPSRYDSTLRNTLDNPYSPEAARLMDGYIEVTREISNHPPRIEPENLHEPGPTLERQFLGAANEAVERLRQMPQATSGLHN